MPRHCCCLGFIDCFAPVPHLKLRTHELNLYATDAAFVELGKPVEEIVRYYGLFDGYSPAKLDLAASAYLAKRYPPTGNPLFSYIKAHMDNDDILGWRRFTSKGWDVTFLDCNHYEIFRQPQAMRRLSERLKSAFK